VSPTLPNGANRGQLSSQERLTRRPKPVSADLCATSLGLAASAMTSPPSPSSTQDLAAPRLPGSGARATPPVDVDDLLARAQSLVGVTVDELAHSLRFSFTVRTATRASGRKPSVHTKGKVGELVERALGASGGSAAVTDFPDLGVELKTIPIDARGKPRESTFVATLSLDNADYAEWETSWVRAKLARVLWIPVETMPTASAQCEPMRRFGKPLLWSPSAAEEATLRADFDEILGIIGIGRIETLTARTGTYLQVRPKAAHGRVRTRSIAAEDGYLETVPRGFYLRARFTESILRNRI
jgi:DNA mismatch repair protein MutH